MTTNQWIVTCVVYGDATNRTGFNTEEEAYAFAEHMNDYVKREGTNHYTNYVVSPKEASDMEISTCSLDNEEPTTMFKCLTCDRETMGTHCIMCMEANSCVKHKEERDPIAGCMSCFREYQEENPTQGGITMKTCPDCHKMITEDEHYCKECETTRRKEHMDKVRKDAYEHLERMGSKEIAIERLCAYANANCMPMYDTWLYPHAVEMYGITRGDYYNDYDELSEEAKMHIGDNWKPLTENHLERLTADLERELGYTKSMSERFIHHIQNDEIRFLRNTSYYYDMVGELLRAVEEHLPPSGGRKIWEL